MTELAPIVEGSEPALMFRNVRKSYRIYSNINEAVVDRLGLYSLRFWRSPPEFPQFEALHGINLVVKRGERVGIIGRNGAGKSTLLKLVTQNFGPTEGDVVVNGSVQAIMRAGLGFHNDFTGRENVRSSLLYSGLGGAAIESAVDDIERFVELGEFFDRPVGIYSQGMIARLQFATATAVRPDIVIIDEVMGAGDAYFSTKCSERMRRLARSGATLLIVSHSLEQISEFCDRVIWLESGAIVSDGAPADVIAKYQKAIDERVGQQESDAAPAVTAEASLKPTEGLSSRSYLTKAILAQEVVETSREHETVDTLANGGTAYRWGPGSRLKIVNLQSKDGHRNTAVGSVGETFEIDISVECLRAGQNRVNYVVMVYAVDGARVARLDSPPDEFEARAGGIRKATMRLPLMLGSGEYLLSVGVFDANGGSEISPDNRFDYLSRSFQLKVTETNDGDPPLFHHAAPWFLGNSVEGVMPVIDGRV